jgi:predicted lipoprotein with Yx(FWY)xxD motif
MNKIPSPRAAVPAAMRRLGIIIVALIAAACSSSSNHSSSQNVTAPTITAPATTVPGSATTAPGPTTTNPSSSTTVGPVTTAAPAVTTSPTVVVPATTAPAPSPTTTVANGMVAVKAGHSSFGEVVTDTAGNSLYLLTSETGGKFTCTQGLCTTFWPPLLVPAGTKVVGGPGVKGTVGVIKRPEGTTQVTYNGYPVYHYKSDSAPGDTMGEGVQSFGGTWYLLAAGATTAGSTAVKGG